MYAHIFSNYRVMVLRFTVLLRDLKTLFNIEQFLNYVVVVETYALVY